MAAGRFFFFPVLSAGEEGEASSLSFCFKERERVYVCVWGRGGDVFKRTDSAQPLVAALQRALLVDAAGAASRQSAGWVGMGELTATSLQV